MSNFCNQLLPYLQLMRLDRPIGSFLLLWPTLWALWLAGEGQPNPTIVIIFIAGTLIMRSAGCVINDYADRDLDKHIERTKERPLTNGEIKPIYALLLFGGLLLLAFVLVLTLNRLSLWIAFTAVGITLIYPFTKRVTQWPQLVLGLAFSMGIPMAYAALTNNVPPKAWYLFTANFFWIVAYDTQYAMADREHDTFVGIKSTAILFGKFDRIAILILQILFIGMMLFIGLNQNLSWHYFLALLFAGMFLIYQHHLIRNRVANLCFKAFLNNIWVGAMIFCGIVLALIQS